MSFECMILSESRFAVESDKRTHGYVTVYRSHARYEVFFLEPTSRALPLRCIGIRSLKIEPQWRLSIFTSLETSQTQSGSILFEIAVSFKPVARHARGVSYNKKDLVIYLYTCIPPYVYHGLFENRTFRADLKRVRMLHLLTYTFRLLS